MVVLFRSPSFYFIAFLLLILKCHELLLAWLWGTNNANVPSNIWSARRTNSFLLGLLIPIFSQTVWTMRAVGWRAHQRSSGPLSSHTLLQPVLERILDTLKLIRCCHRLVSSSDQSWWFSQNKDISGDESKTDFKIHPRIAVVGIPLKCLDMTLISEDIVEAIDLSKASKSGVLIHDSIWEQAQIISIAWTRNGCERKSWR